MVTNTINSQAQISHNCQAGQTEKDFLELMTLDEFKNTITYRKYDFYTDNNTGDLVKTTYTDYKINASVQYTNPIINVFTQQGQLRSHDVSVFCPARVTTLVGGTAITPFRPKINDEIIEETIGYVFRIDNIQIEKYKDTEIYAECMCKRVGPSTVEGFD